MKLKFPMNKIKLQAAFERGSKAMSRGDSWLQHVRTVAGELKLGGKKCQVQVIVTADQDDFFCPKKAGPNAPA